MRNLLILCSGSALSFIMQLQGRTVSADQLHVGRFQDKRQASEMYLPAGLGRITCGQFCRAKNSLGELGLLDGAHPFANMTINLTLDRLHVTSVDNFWKAALSALNSGQVGL